MKQIYFEKFPAGHCELKISCDRPVAWSGGFSWPTLHQRCKRFGAYVIEIDLVIRNLLFSICGPLLPLGISNARK